MKIFDCFMYFDEETILELRLNILDQYVDYFVIVESNFSHNGETRNLKFNPEKFKKFKDKIIYLVYEKQPNKIEKILETDSEDIANWKHISNAILRENGQRNHILQGLTNANQEDYIMISDVDEIPNLENINFNNLKKKIIFFQQDMFYYKFNLKLPDLIWSGTKCCKKKYFESPQWLRNIKDKKYPFYRLDIFFSKTKYSSIDFLNNGGWHFSNLKTAKQIEHKLKSYLHHREFDLNPLSSSEINQIIEDKKAIYDLKVDKRVNKIGNGKTLEKFPIEKLPKYLQNNFAKYKDWID